MISSLRGNVGDDKVISAMEFGSVTPEMVKMCKSMGVWKVMCKSMGV